MSVLASEVVYINRCIAVEVNFRKTNKCYLQLSVLKNNQTHFLTPRTDIVINAGTQTTCNPSIPSIYKIGRSWYRVAPNATESLSPEMMYYLN